MGLLAWGDMPSLCQNTLNKISKVKSDDSSPPSSSSACIFASFEMIKQPVSWGSNVSWEHILFTHQRHVIIPWSHSQVSRYKRLMCWLLTIFIVKSMYEVKGSLIYKLLHVTPSIHRTRQREVLWASYLNVIFAQLIPHPGSMSGLQ